MANENNKIKRLVPLSDDDPTTAFEMPRASNGAMIRAEQGSEVDEKTFDVDRYANGDDPAITTTASLESTIRQQAELIEELQFDLERARGNAVGLETELKAREEISASIGQELKQAKKQLARSRNELQDRHHEIEFLQHSLQESSKVISNLTTEADELRQGSTQELQRYREQISTQKGQIISNAQEVRDLADQLARTEEYADSLRNKLQTQTHSGTDTTRKFHDQEQRLIAAENELRSVQDTLANESIQRKQLVDFNNQLKEDYAQELRQVRFELGAAQETISSKDSLNEQLASDLVDNRGFRQALESQLSEIAETNQDAQDRLERRLRQAQSEAEEFERKLQAKDKAITALMGELASYCQTDDQSNATAAENDADKRSLRGIQSVQKPVREESNQPPRDRIARLLVGNADGRELRFPLFKDRLTIGRTANNDIQLNVRYISRRHAVIVSDNGRTRLVDWGSKNGVFVNQKRVSEKFLQSGDIVTIGTTKFRYEERPKR